jgi:hypothetical protein
VLNMQLPAFAPIPFWYILKQKIYTLVSRRNYQNSRCGWLVGLEFFGKTNYIIKDGPSLLLLVHNKKKSKVAPMLHSLSTTPWRSMGDCMYGSTISWPWQHLEVSSQIHTLAALPPGK